MSRQQDSLDATVSISIGSRLLPVSLRHGTPNDVRAAHVLLTGVAAASAICLLFAVIHWMNGQVARAAVSGLTCIPVAGTLILLWSTERVVPAVHFLLGVCTSIVLVSPFLAHEGGPAIMALVIVPIAAALLSGSRAGTVWAVLVTGLLIGYATLFPFDESQRHAVWLTTVIAGSGGLAATLIERGRELAAREAEIARLNAETDLRDRLVAERTLHESRELLATTFRRSSSGIVLFSLDSGRVLDANDSFTRICGWAPEEVIGKRLSDLEGLTTAEDRQRIAAEAIAKGRIESLELRIRTKSGEVRWLLGSVEVLKQMGRACLLAEGLDITERKHNEDALARYREHLEARFAERGEQLQESLELLRQRDRLAAVGTLAAGVAHQINNPIGAIVAAAEYAVVMDDDADRETIRTEALATVRDQAQRCGRIVKNVLKFSRDEPTAKWVEDLTPTIRRAAELARRHVTERGGRLEMELVPKSLEVRASSIEIEQVVLNLIHNASESKQFGALVRIQTRRQDAFAEIVITDDGDGIDPTSLPHIFEPFYTSRTREGGTGLGLSVVHGIVAEHGGEIEVTSARGEGTQIRVLLPLATEDDRASA